MLLFLKYYVNEGIIRISEKDLYLHTRNGWIIRTIETLVRAEKKIMVFPLLVSFSWDKRNLFGRKRFNGERTYFIPRSLVRSTFPPVMASREKEVAGAGGHVPSTGA